MLRLSNVDIEREACRRSLATFVREAWHVLEPGNPYVHGWHVEAICDHLEAVTCGDILRLLINIPPGTMKSTLVGVFWPAWEWGPRGLAHLRYVTASYEAGLATRDALKMRRLIESEWYQSRWPTEFAADQNQKTYYENTSTGFRQACPVASMTGKRGDRVIWDDPHNVESSLSPADRLRDTRVFRETLPTRLNIPEKSAIIIVMQRLHDADISGVILDGDFGYEHLCLPMEYEPGRACGTSIGFKDPRTEADELLFPERFPRAVVDRDKKILGSYAVAGQFQQRPAPIGGGIFKDEWWQYYTVPPVISWRAIYGDTAQKTGEANDYSVFQCWGRSTTGQAVLLDQIRGKWEAPELQAQARAFWNKHKPVVKGLGTLRAMKIEDKSSGTGLIQTLKREGVPVVGIPRDKDKTTRGMDTAPLIESGNVLLPTNAPWLSDFLTEAGVFPNGSNDDQVDPMMDAVTDMIQNSPRDYGALI